MSQHLSTIEFSNYKVFVNNSIDIFTEIEKFVYNTSTYYSSIFLLIDENTKKHCLPIFKKNINNSKYIIIEIKSGEKNKTLETSIEIWNKLTTNMADRNSLIINLGGGVITDLGGFAAASYLRGIDYINIPTTLMAQVDAAIGGKVGIDCYNLKNRIGFFYEPKAVFIFPYFCNTISKKDYFSGFAEVVKHALIFDRTLWETLNKIINIETIEFNDIFTELIIRSVEIKKHIVEVDFKEKNIRKSLNFGHTVGHAIETYFLKQNNAVSHGEAVAIGIICESFISKNTLMLNEKEFNNIVVFITSRFKLPKINKSAIDEISSYMKFDKKNERAYIIFSLISEIGKVSINQQCPDKLIKESLLYYIENC